MHQAHRRHDDAPKHHNGRNEDRRLQALEQDVGEGFETSVRDEEKRESGVVLAAGHAEVVDEAVDFGVADVGPVEEGDEVEGQPGDDFDVEAADEFLVLIFPVVSCVVMDLGEVDGWLTIAAFSSSLFPASGSGKRSSPSPCSACLACWAFSASTEGLRCSLSLSCLSMMVTR